MSERIAYSRQFNTYGALYVRAVGTGLAMGFYPTGDKYVGEVYFFTKYIGDLDVTVSLRAVDGEDMPVLPDLVSQVVNLSEGVLVGDNTWETEPVYRHIASLPLAIEDGVHYQIVLLPTDDTVTFWMTFRNRDWDNEEPPPIYDKDSGHDNWVNRWRKSADGGITWEVGGGASSWMNFEVWSGIPIFPYRILNITIDIAPYQNLKNGYDAVATLNLLKVGGLFDPTAEAKVENPNIVPQIEVGNNGQ